MIQAINQTHHTNKHLHLQSHSPMESSKMTDATAITIPESRRTHSKGKGLAIDSTPITTTTKAAQIPKGAGGWKRGVAIFDFVLRFVAIAAALSATTIMGTAGETLPFFTQFFQFEASYDDLPTFTFFVIANAMVSGYLVLSLPFSVVCIVRPRASAARFLLIILDTVMVALTIAAAGAATSIVYLAHNGNQGANWLAICNQFGDFCQATSEAVVASFICAFILMALVVLSAFALRKH